MPEVLIALAIAGMVLAIGVPALNTAVRSSRLDAATDEIAGDIRTARAQAITTGWEFRVVGFDNSSATNANSYRVLSRRSTAVAWPADDVAPYENATSTASAWTNLEQRFANVRLGAATPSRFQLTFDARGATADAAGQFNTLTLTEDAGETRAMTVSVVGSLRIQ